ncbi:tripartite motif-containing protein 66 [Carettochelys insculpta]|uniref:tripartite motif-containing protein 66 n=1 Tax=Carettochelys insculpta TaxID=44489 RepID=UPI003EBD3C55
MARSCSTCKEKRPAHSLCTNCNKWLCSSCTEEHRHGKETGDHFLSVPLKGSSGTEGGTNEFSLLCPIHSQESLKLFCETCDVLTCRNCLLTDHKEHRFMHLEEALRNQRVILENVTAKVEERKTGMQVSAKQIEDRLFEVKHLHRKVENQIKMAKMVLMNEINKRTNVLLEQLERITSERKQKLEQQLQGIMVLSRQFEHVQNFINWAVCRKNSIPFLFSKELIVFQIQHLLEANCNTEVGPPWNIRFTWDPSFWTKQLSNLGSLTMEGGHIPHSDVPAYGNMPGLPTSLFHGQHSPAPQLEPINNQSHQFPLPVQSPRPMCCSRCFNIPHMNKGQRPLQHMSHHQSFRQPLEMQQLPPQNFPLQYNVQHHEKEQRATPQPLKLTQPCLEQQSHLEQDIASVRMGKHLQAQQSQQTAHPVYTVPPQDIHQVHTSHVQQLHPPPALQTPTVQVQVGHLQKLKLNHVQPQQQQQQQPQPPPPPPSSSQNENAHEQVIQQSLDIMHHQFELEEMKKDLELLLQAQGQPSLQLNQAKQPQHVQQTIVGQINYIVRQPAPVQQQIQDEVQQACEDSAELESEKPVLSLDRNVIPPPSQPVAEEPSNPTPESALQHSSLNPLRKRSASLNVVGLSNPIEMEPSSTRLSRLVDPQIQGVSMISLSEPQNMLHASDVQPKSVPNYGLALNRTTNDPNSWTTDNLEMGDVLLGNTKCKLENEDFSTMNDLLGNDSDIAGANTITELTLPIQKMLEEPINLSIKKTQQCASPSTAISSASCLQPTTVKELRNEEDSNNSKQEHTEMDAKSNQNIRTYTKELKIPYVRLERLKICASESGELPVFKLQPQKGGQDETFLLIIECGTQSSSMAIKVNHDSLPEGRIPTYEDSEDKKVSISHPSGQAPSTFVDIPPVDHSLSNGIPSMKKSLLAPETNPIENEDFCAVCLNGGELLCCDHCPKVFHLSCHVPALLSFPVGEWVCTLCRNLLKPEVEYDCENTRYSHCNKGDRALHGLDDIDQKKCEKLVLSLFCSSLSLPFHEPVSPLARHYYQIIKRPMDLSVMRQKLQKKDKSHYSSPEELVTDVRLMFWNCAKFNYPDSEVAEAGRCLEVFFESRLKDIFPDKRFPLMQQEDSDSEEVERENTQMAPKGFPWPSYGQECIQPKRRRRHAESEKTKRPTFQPAYSFPQV